MKLIKNYLYNVGYQIFSLIIPLITVPYVSRILGSEGVGINAFTNSIIQYFILFGSIGINLYGNRTIAYNRDSKEKLSQIFWEISFLRIVFITISYFIFLFFLFVVNNYKMYYLYQSILIIASAVDISWFFMGMEDFKKTVVRNMLIKVCSLIAIFLFVKTSTDTGKYILILSLSSLFGNLTLWSYLKKIVSPPKVNQLNIMRHLQPSLTLFIPQIATQIYLVLNKTMLGAMSGVKSAGYYENSDKLVKIVLAIVTATGTVMLPRVANTHAKGNKELVENYMVRSFDFVSAICFPLALGLAAIAPKFSIWFFGSEFKVTGGLIVVLSQVIVWIGWSNVLGTQYLLPTNQTKYYTYSVIGGAIANLVLNIFFIQLFGVYGAVYATVISEIVVTIIQLYYVNRSIKLKVIFSSQWKYFLASLFMYLVVATLNTHLSGNILNFFFQLLVGMIIYFGFILFLKPPVVKEIKNILNYKT